MLRVLHNKDIIFQPMLPLVPCFCLRCCSCECVTRKSVTFEEIHPLIVTFASIGLAAFQELSRRPLRGIDFSLCSFQRTGDWQSSCAFLKSFVELNGIEPMTSGLQSPRSPFLSYSPE